MWLFGRLWAAVAAIYAGFHGVGGMASYVRASSPECVSVPRLWWVWAEVVDGGGGWGGDGGRV